MRFIRIFVSGYSEDGIWSIHLHKKRQNEFAQFFDLVNDVEWLYHFFEENKTDLHSGFFGEISVADMKRDHLKKELRKLEQTSGFLRDNGINYPEDLSVYPYE